MKKTQPKKIRLLNKNDQQHANEILKKYYDEKVIPAEKKPYLAALRQSAGAFLGIHGDNEISYMLDSSCQIATIGTGFNAHPHFGVLHHQACWDNDLNSQTAKIIRHNYKNFLQRKLGWAHLNMAIRNSGAEANETALGLCYMKRRHSGANRLLAFEGSFHGRMQVTLAATWNPSKRTPFEWPGKEAVYLPYPEVKTDQILIPIPKGWNEFWENATGELTITPEEWRLDPDLALETQCLLQVREQLKTESIFAIIIEPMQCEGGDRYATNRFFNGLLLLAKGFKIPVVFDEVQTGFHLGKSFFWHKSFCLHDSSKKPLLPDYVVCAKKAQVGLVLSPHLIPDSGLEEISVASMLRGLNQGLAMDQMRELFPIIEEKVRTRSQQLVKAWPNHLSNVRANGLAFAIDLKDPAFLNKFIDLRFKYGQLFYPAGDYTLRFRVSASFNDDELNLMFEGLSQICQELFAGKTIEAKDIDISKSMDQFEQVEDLYQWHELLLETRIANWTNQKKNFLMIWNNALKLIPSDIQIEVIDKKNIKTHLEAIEALQVETYEPTRQTHRSLFEAVANSSTGIGIIALKGKQLCAISFAGPSALYPKERGLKRDAEFGQDHQLYFIDTTVKKGHQNSGIGRKLKYLTLILAAQKDAQTLVGRNRDLLAGAMLNVNLGLGALETDYVKEDYLDDERARDVIHYKINLRSDSNLNLSDAITSPLKRCYEQKDLRQKLAPLLVNKICLSNFVDTDFLQDINDLMQMAPKSLRHGYSTSGQSECVDKIIKSMWYQGRKQQNLLTFDGHYFGNGSFFARGLSNVWNSNYFNTVKVPSPNGHNDAHVLQLVENELKNGHLHSIWIEPLRQLDFSTTPASFLKSLLDLGHRYQTPVVFNETASSMYRYHRDHFYAANDNICPDAAMLYMGGQAGLCLVKTEYFVDKPLMLISTWDGDQASTAIYAHAAREVRQRYGEWIEIRRIFQEVLKETLEQAGAKDIQMQLGIGSFTGALPYSMQSFFKYHQGRYAVCPNWQSMLDFLNFARNLRPQE